MLGDTSPPDWAKLVIACLVGALLIYVPFTILFYINRRMYPIRGRMPRVVLLLNLSMFLLATQTSLTSILAERLPCVIRNWCAGLLASSCLAIYAYRLTRVLFAYEITKNIMELQKTEKAKEWKENWYTRHRNLLRPKEGMIMGLCFVAYNLVFLIPVTIDQAKVYGSLKGCRDVQDEAHSGEVILTYKVAFDQIVVYLYNFILGIRLFRKHSDAFYLRTEFIWTLGACFITIVLYFGFIGLGLGPYISVFLAVITLHIIFITGTVMPYYLSIKSRHVTSSLSLELSDIITTSHGFTAFLEYLQLEFSAENLLFWGEIQFMKITLNSSPNLTSNQIFIMLNDIYHKFISIGAPCQITIPASLVYEIAQYIQREDESEVASLIQLFEQAQTEIYHLMKGDSFVRFQQTQEYQKVKASLTSSARHEKKASTSHLTLSVAERFACGIFDPHIQSTKRSKSMTALTSVQSSLRQPCVSEIEFECLQQHPEEQLDNNSPKSSVDDP